ncbi:MAG: hypothetical protein VX589_00075, partial [Myxococcota bacterium]|nr:hypothetical protein [Myxococcota bacterium]
MVNRVLFIAVIAVTLWACEGEETNGAAIICGAGTTLSAAGDICEPNLTEGVSVNATGEIVADKTGSDTDTAIAAAREEGRVEGVASVDVTTDNQAAFDEGAASVDITTDNEAAREEGRTEGVASVTPLNCAEGTAENEAGDACEPTAEYRAAAVEEGRAAGVASVTPLNCGDGTAVNDAGDACVPTAEYRAAAVEEGRAAGIASVTPLNCGDGTAVNDAGDACEPTAEYRAAAVEEGRLAGVASVDITANDADVVAAATADLFTQAELDAARQAGVDSVDITSNDADVIAAATADLFTQAELDAARQAGADSVTPLNCALGTAENDAGDACEPNLSVDVAIGDGD